MKIALFDPYWPKFTVDMVAWWRKAGHEVRYDRYYDPELVDWADVVWFDTCDNNIKSATNPSEALLSDWQRERKRDIPWALQDMDLTGKKIIVRPIDIEVWYGHQDGVDWSTVTDCIFIAPHIRALMLDRLPYFVRTHTIPCGVNLDRYSYREHSPGYDIAVVCEKWTSKGTDLILQIAHKLHENDERYTIHWLGKWSDYEWEKAYFEDFIKAHDLKFVFTEWIEGDNAVNEFLEDKDYLLCASHKEAFSYATAEAMAKGIKPVMHRFYGAEDLWPGMTWSSIDEAVDMIVGTPIERYVSSAYVTYLRRAGYTLEQMMEKIMEVING